MSEKPPAPAWLLSVVVAGLMFVQSTVGLLVPSLYQDTEEWILAAWFGNDLVTLLVAFPLLVWSLAAARKGSRRAELVWYSMLGYSVYNYAYYLFGAALNWFFPVYVVLFTLPVFALILSLGCLDTASVSSEFAHKTPVRWVGGYMLFSGAGLTLAWLGQWINFMLTGAIPDIGEEGLRLVAAMDLSFTVPWFVIGAVLLIRRRPWGFVIAPIIITKGATYTLVLTATSTVASVRGIDGTLTQVPFWAVWTLAGAAALWGLLGQAVGPSRTAGDVGEPAAAPGLDDGGAGRRAPRPAGVDGWTESVLDSSSETARQRRSL